MTRLQQIKQAFQRDDDLGNGYPISFENGREKGFIEGAQWADKNQTTTSMKIEIEIPDGKKAEWVNGVLTLVDKPIEYKFKVGDKVIANGKTYEITDTIAQCGKPAYRLEDLVGIVYEAQIIGYAPQDITERIKTFEDAKEWCENNGKASLVGHWEVITEELIYANDIADLLAYLKLRIIACALNEGWEPTFDLDETRWLVKTEGDEIRICYEQRYNNTLVSGRMFFKTCKLAQYAAEQFADIYADFSRCKEGGEE